MLYSWFLLVIYFIYACVHAKSFQLCLTLCDPMDHSLPGSSVHGILQARIMEWVASPPPGIFPTQGSNPCLLRLLNCQSDSLPLAPRGKHGRLFQISQLGVGDRGRGGGNQDSNPGLFHPKTLPLVNPSPEELVGRPEYLGKITEAAGLCCGQFQN